jgi:H+/Cl- antiporter ClcA
MLPSDWLARSRALSDRTRTTLLLWIGAALVGVVAVLLAEVANWASARFLSVQARWAWAPLLIVPLGGMTVLWIMRRLAAAPKAAASRRPRPG